MPLKIAAEFLLLAAAAASAQEFKFEVDVAAVNVNGGLKAQLLSLKTQPRGAAAANGSNVLESTLC